MINRRKFIQGTTAAFSSLVALPAISPKKVTCSTFHTHFLDDKEILHPLSGLGYPNVEFIYKGKEYWVPLYRYKNSEEEYEAIQDVIAQYKDKNVEVHMFIHKGKNIMGHYWRNVGIWSIGEV